MPSCIAKYTIDSQICGMSDRPGCICCAASVLSAVNIVHRAEDEDAGPGADHGGGQGGARADHVPLQTPGDCDRQVSVRHDTC